MNKLLIALSLLVSNFAWAKPAETIRNALSVSARVSVGNLVGGSAVAAMPYKQGTLFLSNDHVCQWSRGKALLGQTPSYISALNAVSVSLTFVNGEVIKGKVVYVSNSTNPVKASIVSDDLCLIYVEKALPYATLSAQDAEIGEEVFSVGAPHGWFPHVAGGYVGGYLHQKELYIGSASLMIGEGSSGGGVFAKTGGELIGVAFAIEPAVKDIPVPLQAYYVPVSRVQNFLAKYQAATKKKEKK